MSVATIEQTETAAESTSTSETAAEALERIQNGFSQNDLAAIYYFNACGIPAADIDPRHNVLTFKAWKAKGRQVAKGVKGFPTLVWIPGKKLDENGNPKCWPKTVRLFHESQTVPTGSEKGTLPPCHENPYLYAGESSDVTDEQRAAQAEKAHNKGKEAADLAPEAQAHELKRLNGPEPQTPADSEPEAVDVEAAPPGYIIQISGGSAVDVTQELPEGWTEPQAVEAAQAMAVEFSDDVVSIVRADTGDVIWTRDPEAQLPAIIDAEPQPAAPAGQLF